MSNTHQLNVITCALTVLIKFIRNKKKKIIFIPLFIRRRQNESRECIFVISTSLSRVDNSYSVYIDVIECAYNIMIYYLFIFFILPYTKDLLKSFQMKRQKRHYNEQYVFPRRTRLDRQLLSGVSPPRVFLFIGLRYNTRRSFRVGNTS